MKVSKLDLAHAYQQVLLDEESRKFVIVNTHQGLFQYTHLFPFWYCINSSCISEDNGQGVIRNCRRCMLF